MTLSKVCGCCKKEKSESEYHYRSIDSKKLNSWCKDCKNISRKERRRHTPDCKKKAKQYYLKQWYGLSVEQYESMYEKQKGSCAICNVLLSLTQDGPKGNRVHVDHCHRTGKVRGLLCTKCNTILGMANDNASTLAAAIIYLDRSQDD
jgi:hypothetical protein